MDAGDNRSTVRAEDHEGVFLCATHVERESEKGKEGEGETRIRQISFFLLSFFLFKRRRCVRCTRIDFFYSKKEDKKEKGFGNSACSNVRNRHSLLLLKIF